MARGRRGGPPPDLRGTLGTLLRSTLEQVGAVKNAALRGAESQRVWIDGALLQRKHREAMAELGERVYELIISGELSDVEARPAVGEVVARIEELEVRLSEATERTREVAHSARQTAASFAARAGFPEAGIVSGLRRGSRDEPGARMPQHREPNGEPMRVWRPTRSSASENSAPFATEAAAQSNAEEIEPPRRARARRARRTPHDGGGIQFVSDSVSNDLGSSDDDDLEQYMHPDDVSEADPSGDPARSPDAED